MSRLALAWLDTALELEAENRALRELVVALAFALARKQELDEYAEAEIEARFPSDEEAA